MAAKNTQNSNQKSAQKNQGFLKGLYFLLLSFMPAGGIQKRMIETELREGMEEEPEK